MTTATGAAAGPASGFSAHHAALRHLARRVLGKGADADHVVQLTMLAAMTMPLAPNDGSAAWRWLHRVLRQQIAEVLRGRSCAEPRAAPCDDDRSGPGDDLFDATGHWRVAPARGPSGTQAEPGPAVADTVDDLLARLPPNVARAYAMRELLAFEIDEIAAVLGITPGDCGVLLHRARLSMHAMLLEHGGAMAARS